jgi:pyruvate/2-oxoglutarate dehydrogenase complex dihydrolipoamide acyltransferase (E2) component
MIRSKIYAPYSGDKVRHCKLVRWHREDASEVNVGDLIATLEAKKVINEIEAGEAGILRHCATEGETVAIGSHFAVIERDGLSKVDDSMFLTMEICHDDLCSIDRKRGEMSRDDYALQCLR